MNLFDRLCNNDVWIHMVPRGGIGRVRTQYRHEEFQSGVYFCNLIQKHRVRSHIPTFIRLHLFITSKPGLGFRNYCPVPR